MFAVIERARIERAKTLWHDIIDWIASRAAFTKKREIKRAFERTRCTYYSNRVPCTGPPRGCSKYI